MVIWSEPVKVKCNLKPQQNKESNIMQFISKKLVQSYTPVTNDLKITIAIMVESLPGYRTGN